MFNTLIVQPIYNLLVAIYGLLPGHDLGLSLIIFTILVRLALWPLLKKQLHQSKKMRDLQPELTKIRRSAAGDRQKEAAMMMELYKEKGISPFGTIGLTLVQLPIFIGVFQAARELTEHLDKISSLTYGFVRDIPHIASVIKNSDNFNFVSLGFVDLSRKAIDGGKIYWPVLLIAALATILQFIQSKQLLPQPKEKKRLRDLFRASSQGNQPAQEDMSAAMSGTMLYLMPLLTLLFAIYAQGAMVVYLLASSAIGIFQQSLIFKKDTEEMEAEVVSVKSTPESSAAPKPTEKVNRGKVVTKTRIITPENSSPTPTPKKKRRKKR
jgi:YidC/Oxa1 family membrane protein insertase